MSVSLTLQSVATAREIPESGVDAAQGSQLVHDGFDLTYSLDENSTPPVAMCVYRELALVAGALTIDLTTITGSYGSLQNGNGKKVQHWRVKNTSETATLVFVKGASNPYLLKGADWKVELLPGQWDEFYGNNAAPEIDATHKEIDVSGTGGTGTDTFELSLSMG